MTDDRVYRCPHCHHLAVAPNHEIDRLRADIAHLRQWKAEAIVVLSEWDDVWKAAGCPGPLGGSKAAAVRDQLDRLRDEIDR